VTSGADRLRNLDFAPGYDSSDDVLGAFYVPALSCAVRYDRSVGYFRSTALAVAARGVSRFISRGGRIRLLAGIELTEDDCRAMRGRMVVPDALAERLGAGLATDDDITRHRLEVLAWLSQTNRLTIRLALPVDADGHPVPSAGYFHEKIGVLRDADGEGVAFQGSVNETATAWTRNFESFSVYRSWREDTHFDLWAGKFDRHWAGRMPGWRVVDLPVAVRDRLVDLAPAAPPPARDPEEAPELGDPRTITRFLLAAPTMAGGEGLAEATSGVTAFPHQRQVAERLAGEYPRSWLVADEVGLGKTISAGLALRRLVLDGRVRRALILAPAMVCRQWQDELFEKFGLWPHRFDSGRWLGAHPTFDEPVDPGTNPYAARDLAIVSSHLARRRDHQQLIVDAGPWDLVVVDEAHHARRQGFARLGEYRPSRLLQLLDRTTTADAARAVWLMTATPMQVHPIELRDLLTHVGLTGALADWSTFERWHAALAEPDDATPWEWLGSVYRDTPLPADGPTEKAVLVEIESRRGPVVRRLVERFGDPNADLADTVAQLGPEGRADLRHWLRSAGPVGRFVTRHGRSTLRRYQASGLLREPVAHRHVEPVPIGFNADEAALYQALDDLIDRLMDAAGTRRGAGFVLTVYRRRLTSSWAAIRATLERRLAGGAGFELDDDLREEAESALGSVDVDSVHAVPLTEVDMREIRRFIADSHQVGDSKFDQLVEDVDNARTQNRAAIVFTQFTDTLEYLRDRLRGVYRTKLATFTGDGGRVWDDSRDAWASITRQELVEAVRSSRVQVLLATDAASEGLNLQTCSFLVNYDMPWNPMRVEQRIGRIDRIGQQEPVVQVRNYFVPGTIEERVYQLLAERIGDFSELLGSLQPILGAAEDAVRNVLQAAREDRGIAAKNELDALGTKIDAVRAAGIELGDDDPHPGTSASPAPVTLSQLDERLRHLGVRLGTATCPASADPAQVSRDEVDWTALTTYGHPRLAEQLDNVLDGADLVGADGGLVIGRDVSAIDEGVIVTAQVRDDRAPPEPLTTVADVGDLATAVSTAEALQLASSVAGREASRRLALVQLARQVRSMRRQDDIRRRIIRLAHRVIATECTLRREEQGMAPLPADVWRGLGRDPSGWRYADQIRDRLGLTIDDVAPDRLAEPDAFKPGWPKRSALHETADELLDHARQWDSLARGRAGHT
jgi:hypothetical protein